jgi:hypothetical protein
MFVCESLEKKEGALTEGEGGSRKTVAVYLPPGLFLFTNNPQFFYPDVTAADICKYG